VGVGAIVEGNQFVACLWKQVHKFTEQYWRQHWRAREHSAQGWSRCPLLYHPGIQRQGTCASVCTTWLPREQRCVLRHFLNSGYVAWFLHCLISKVHPSPSSEHASLLLCFSTCCSHTPKPEALPPGFSVGLKGGRPRLSGGTAKEQQIRERQRKYHSPKWESMIKIKRESSGLSDQLWWKRIV